MITENEFGHPPGVCLCDVSERDKPWDVHRHQSELVASLYALSSSPDFLRYFQRMNDCSRLLDFVLRPDDDTGESKLKLHEARFCRCRQCPVCQWRRSMMWRARFLKVLPRIFEIYPGYRFIFLTLTVSNCDIEQLNSTISKMNAAWQRLIQSKVFPATGFVRSLEVTRASDDRAHPHFHCLLMVSPRYFTGESYLKQVEWTELWRRSLRVEYTPIVDVRAVKPKPGRLNYVRSLVPGDQKEGSKMPTSQNAVSEGVTEVLSLADLAGLQGAILETLKYSVKPGDLIGSVDLDEQQNLRETKQNWFNAAWLYELTRQMHNVRAIALGGVLKDFLKEDDPEDLIHPEGEEIEQVLESDLRLLFGWRSESKRYKLQS